MYRLSLFLVSGSLLIACQDTLAPAGQQLTARDQATIRGLLADPILALTLSTFADPGTGARLRGRLAGLRDIAGTASPRGLSESVMALRADLLGAREAPGSADGLGFEIAALTLDQIDDAVTISRDATGAP